MAQEVRETTNVVAWPIAQRYLRDLAAKWYRLAAKGPTEWERGRCAGRAEMCEELQTLPETLALLAQEDERAKADVQGKSR